MFKKILSYLKRTITRPEGLKLNETGPVSRYFGLDRGTPIDRYYIEKFLKEKKAHIKGIVLEIADSKYSRKYDSGVTSFEILHLNNENRDATIIGDLSNPSSLPNNIANCFICTQTINFIYNYTDAIKGTYQLLQENGILLLTIPGISQISRFDFDRWGEYWRFTTLSAQRAFEEVYKKGNVEVNFFGNCLAATSFLRGIASEEINSNKLDEKDEDYQVTITVMAKKTLDQN